jgi:hypothetical protein
MEAALGKLCADAAGAARAGTNILILSDRGIGPDHAPIPILLALAGVHHHLIREGLRTKVGLVAETGEHGVTHFALIGDGGAEPLLASDDRHLIGRRLPRLTSIATDVRTSKR